MQFYPNLRRINQSNIIDWLLIFPQRLVRGIDFREITSISVKYVTVGSQSIKTGAKIEENVKFGFYLAFPPF